MPPSPLLNQNNPDSKILHLQSNKLLFLLDMAMVVLLNNALTGLDAKIGSALAVCFLKSRVSHKLLSLNQCKNNKLKANIEESFDIQLVDGQEVPDIRKVNYYVDLGLIKTSLVFLS